jgi:hypothetical protein
MHACHLRACRLQRREAFAQRALQRAHIEHNALRWALRELLQDLVRRGHRCGDHDQLLIQRDRLPVAVVRDVRVAHRRVTRVRALDRESLCGEIPHEPAAHVTRTADHERAPATALPARRDRVLLLHRQRAANQREDQLFAQLRREAVLDRRGARTLHDVALLAVITRRDARVALYLTDLLRDRLALGHQLEDLAIDLTELLPEWIQLGAIIFGHASEGTSAGADANQPA